MRSVIQRDETYCYICKEKYGIDALQPTEEHHVFGGPLRAISEKNGLKVRLCHRHHTEGPEAVHRCQAMNADTIPAESHETGVDADHAQGLCGSGIPEDTGRRNI